MTMWILGLGMAAWSAEPAPAPPSETSWGNEGPGGSRDPFAEKRLRKIVQRVVPEVERAAGRPFRQPPKVELATPGSFDVILREEQALIQSAVNRDTDPALRARLVADARARIPPGLLGKYAVFEDTLYLCPDNLRVAATELGVSSLTEVVTLVLVHELGHALHDQYVDLAGLVGNLPDQDALWAFEGTTEGLANFVEARVARQLGLDDLSEKMNGLQGWSTKDGPASPGAFRIWSLYGQGAAMMAWHYDQGGVDRFWKVALQPPASSRGLFRPETWPAMPAAPSLDYAAVLRGTEQVVTRGDWLIAISRLGEGPLRAEAFSGGDPDALDPVLAEVAEAWQLDAVRTDRRAEIRILTFRNAAGATAYLGLMKGHDQGVASRLGSQLDREVEVVTAPFEAVAGDAAARRTSMVVGLSGTRLERRSAWVVRGDTLVVVLTEDFRPGKRLAWAIETVFARLEAARRGQPLPSIDVGRARE